MSSAYQKIDDSDTIPTSLKTADDVPDNGIHEENGTSAAFKDGSEPRIESSLPPDPNFGEMPKSSSPIAVDVNNNPVSDQKSSGEPIMADRRRQGPNPYEIFNKYNSDTNLDRGRHHGNDKGDHRPTNDYSSLRAAKSSTLELDNTQIPLLFPDYSQDSVDAHLGRSQSSDKALDETPPSSTVGGPSGRLYVKKGMKKSHSSYSTTNTPTNSPTHHQHSPHATPSPFKSVIRKISKHVYFDRIPKFSTSSSDNKVFLPDEKLESKNDLYLFEEEMEEKLPATSIISSLSNHKSSVPQNVPHSLTNGPPPRAAIKQAKLGTIMGVFMPCIQNIFGVILFLRMNWIVGIAGAIQAVAIICICCSVTLLTAISMSAIATNGVVPAGGSYFMISRSLGPEFGGAVGFLFYLATTFGAAMYTIGAVEILLIYLAPNIAIFHDTYHNFRVYGTCFLVLMTLVVMVGVKLVNRIATVSLICVLLSILAIYVGIFAYFYGNPKVWICLLGSQLLKRDAYDVCSKFTQDGNRTKVWQSFCEFNNRTGEYQNCNPYFLSHNLTRTMGIPGLGSGVFMDNIKERYMTAGEANPGEWAINKNIVQAYITTSFTILLGIYFPSVTGIMAGSNRSGDLADAQKSIPSGTLAAIIFTSIVYISGALLFAASISSPLARDKFGQSIGGGMIVANLGWPHPLVVTIGSFLSTMGAALQSLTGAPRLLQAISKDNIVPFLRWFTKTSKSGEPWAALALTFVIALIGICIGNLDLIAPILTMFFLMCYGFVNLACALQTLLKTPNWRPRFRYYHWTLSLLGLALCVAAMFISSWYYALVAIAIACALYKYIEYYGAEKEWGDGFKGLQLSTALYALLRSEQATLHTKNWRPQLLVLCKFDDKMGLTHPRLLSFAHQLKAGKGLTVCGTALKGDWTKNAQEAFIIKERLKQMMVREKVKGFVDVVMTKDIYTGIMDMIQLAGLGSLRHNAIVMAWPKQWKEDSKEIPSWKIFVDVIRAASSGNMAFMVMKGQDNFPENTTKLPSGTIDVWWIVHDGGLLMLIPFLLKQNKVWKNCTLRIFTVAQFEDNSVQLKKNLETFIYSLRLKAQVEIVEMHKSDISAYTYERTLMMEQRTQMLRQLNLSRKESLAVVQTFIDSAHETSQPQQTYAVVDNNLAVPGVQPNHVQPNGGRVSIMGNIFNTGPDASNDKSGPPVSDTQLVGDINNNNNIRDGQPDAVKVDKDDELNQQQQQPPLSPFGTPLLARGADDLSNGQLNNNNGGRKSASPYLDKKFTCNRIDAANVKRMHAAIKLNEAIRKRSQSAHLVLLNMPGSPKNRKGDENFMEYLEALTEGLDRVLLIRGSGQEVVTIYS